LNVTKSTGTTTIPIDDTIPTSTEGDQYMSQAITPLAKCNVLRISVLTHAATASGAHWLISTLLQDSGNSIAAGLILSPGASFVVQLSIYHEMVAGTVSSTTFKNRVGCDNAGTTTVNGTAGVRELGGVLQSYLKIEEIMG
jgi:hypothetical protein